MTTTTTATASTTYKCPNVHSPAQLSKRGYDLFGAGNLNDAVVCLTEALKYDPIAKQQERLHRINLGKMFQQLGHPTLALRELEIVAAADPHDTLPLLTIGTIYKMQKEYHKAAEVFERVTKLDPSLSEPWFHLGLCSRRAGDLNKAEKAYLESIKRQPDFSNAHFNLGRIYYDLKQPNKAKKYLELAVKYQPQFSQAYNSLGVIHQEQNNLHEAIRYFRLSAKIQPNDAMTFVNLGNVYTVLNDREMAIKHFRQAVKLNPNAFEGQYSLGRALKSKMAMNEAAKHLLQALKLTQWKNAPTFASYVHTLHFLCDWDAVAKHLPALHELVEKQLADQVSQLAITPFQAFTYNFSLPLFQRLGALMSKNALDAATTKLRNNPDFAIQELWWNDPSLRQAKQSRLRLSYLSSDIKSHPLSRLMKTVWHFHNKSRVESTVLATTPDDGSEERKFIASSAEHFSDVTQVSDIDIAQKVRQSQAHVLINLNGWTKGERNTIFGLKPAPISVSHLGFCGSMGDRGLTNYLITDPIASPVEFAEHYSENMIYMPNSYFVNDYKRQQAHVPNLADDREHIRRRHNLPPVGKAVVFANFNQLYKIDNVTFSHWMTILKRVPNSLMWLLKFPIDAQPQILAQARAHGVSESQIVFGEHLDHDQHVQRIIAADLILDTPLCNGHTSTVDSLWAGTPMITLPGHQMAQRVAAGMAHAVGLYDEMVVNSMEQYQERAIHLATHPDQLAHLRSKLELNRKTHPLFNTQLWVSNMESGLTMAWELFAAKKKKWHIVVT